MPIVRVVGFNAAYWPALLQIKHPDMIEEIDRGRVLEPGLATSYEVYKVDPDMVERFVADMLDDPQVSAVYVDGRERTR